MLEQCASNRMFSILCFATRLICPSDICRSSFAIYLENISSSSGSLSSLPLEMFSEAVPKYDTAFWSISSLLFGALLRFLADTGFLLNFAEVE